MANSDVNEKEIGELAKGDGHKAPGLEEFHEARLRWGTMAMSAILGCAANKEVGMRKFIDYADKTQRKLVAQVAKEFYAGELGLTEDVLDTFLTITSLGITGCGFNYELPAEMEEGEYVFEAYQCPITDHGFLAGYEAGDPAYDELSLWCDTYDNFESEAVCPHNVLVHSHCLGQNKKSCRGYCVTLDDVECRKDGEHIHDYTRRLRDVYIARKPEGPWAMDGMDRDLRDEISTDGNHHYIVEQSQLAPTLLDRKKMGAEIWGRIGAVSTMMACSLMGSDKYIGSMSDKQGPSLQSAAKKIADKLGIKGDSVNDALRLYLELLRGQGFGAHKITEVSNKRIEGSCAECPIIAAGKESGLGEDAKQMMGWCSAARTYEAQILDKDISFTYTNCIGKGGKECRWVIEKK